MYFLYSLLLTLGVIALLPRFVVDAFRHGKYVQGWRERLGRLPAIETEGRPVIWLHCVSVGEAQAARPLARAILDKFPSHTLVVSTTTLTGQRIARDVFRGDAAAVIYFPFDWAWTVRRSLRAVNPDIVLIMETELWPNFLRECRKRGVNVAIVNGRLSHRSFRRYRIIRRFSKRIVNDLDLALMQTDGDAERMRALGLAHEHVFVSGNVKFDASDDARGQALFNELRERFHFGDGRPLIVAASTHSPEERIILEAFKQLRSMPGREQTRLLIAPRHPERFTEVAALLESSGFVWTRRSEPGSEHDYACDVVLLDSIGELRAVYPLASIVFVGGSLTPTGGHNILEPAMAGVCTVTGAHTFNFTAIVRDFLEADALIQLPALSEEDTPLALMNVFRGLLANDERRLAIGGRARAVLERNRGATARTIKLLAPLFNASSDSPELPQTESSTRGALSA
ncbi:MAG: 3-deoxy-D-manno-octulosonic-acid transferase [Acidobacteriota bacterium]|jgi:3-deoxy-D-manno-octulosonic-acid transferase|nr:3-deoxy-D-manno-octulosonic-acid transferase [Acidobacteriota bacterium]